MRDAVSGFESPSRTHSGWLVTGTAPPEGWTRGKQRVRLARQSFVSDTKGIQVEFGERMEKWGSLVYDTGSNVYQKATGQFGYFLFSINLLQ